MGVSKPVGSFSKNSSNYNDFGKANVGLNIKAGAEYFINPKNAISIDFDYVFFFNATNDSLSAIVKRRVDSYNVPYIEAGDQKTDISMAHIMIGYSRLFNFKRFTIQTRINAGTAAFGYDYTAAYALTNALTTSTSITPSSINLTTISYSFNDQRYFTLKPELLLKTILQKRKYADLALSFGIGYFYARPNMTLIEDKDSHLTKVLTLKDNINVVTINVSLNLLLKRTLASVFK